MAAAEVNRGPRLTERFWAAFTTLKLCSHSQINVAMWPDMNVNMRGGERAKSEGTTPTGRPADGTERRPDTKKRGHFLRVPRPRRLWNTNTTSTWNSGVEADIPNDGEHVRAGGQR